MLQQVQPRYDKAANFVYDKSGGWWKGAFQVNNILILGKLCMNYKLQSKSLH